MGGPDHSGIITLDQRTLNTGGGIFYTNTRPGTTAVVVFIGLVNLSAGSSDAIFIAKNIGLSQQAVFHSGIVGAGSGDRFPLTCLIAIQENENIGWLGGVGSWGIVTSGYYYPTVLTG